MRYDATRCDRRQRPGRQEWQIVFYGKRCGRFGCRRDLFWRAAATPGQTRDSCGGDWQFPMERAESWRPKKTWLQWAPGRVDGAAGTMAEVVVPRGSSIGSGRLDGAQCGFDTINGDFGGAGGWRVEVAHGEQDQTCVPEETGGGEKEMTVVTASSRVEYMCWRRESRQKGGRTAKSVWLRGGGGKECRRALHGPRVEQQQQQ